MSETLRVSPSLPSYLHCLKSIYTCYLQVMEMDVDMLTCHVTDGLAEDTAPVPLLQVH